MALTVRKLNDYFGAELRGLDLRKRLSVETLQEIYDAFLQYGVLVIPGQPLSVEQQLAFARTFGDLWMMPEAVDRVRGVERRIADRAINDISNIDTKDELAGATSSKVLFQLANQLWHTDNSVRPVPAHASMLHAVEIVTEGGETQFADLIAPYEALPDARKAALSGLIAEHSPSHARIKTMKVGENLDLDAVKAAVPPAPQPVVRTHPETGRKGLFVSLNAQRILGMGPSEGMALIEEMVEHITQPAYVYSHRWAIHDLVIWDNRRVLHRATPYAVDTDRRVMHRATVAGEVPTVVDGFIAEPVVARRSPRPHIAM